MTPPSQFLLNDSIVERFKQWLAGTQDLSQHSVRAYTQDVRIFVAHVGEGFDLRLLHREHVEGFLEFIATTNSTTSIRRRMFGVRRFCKWLMYDGLLDNDPFQDLLYRLGRPLRLPRAIPLTDVRSLIHHLTWRESHSLTRSRQECALTTLVAVALMLETGMRVGELVNVRFLDVDLDGGSIRVEGKGRRERIVYLCNPTLGELIRELQQRAGLESERTLLVNRDGRPLTTAALRSRLARNARSSGLTQHITPHMLRHTAATQLVEAGVDIRFVQRLLGHASLTTTEIYTHVADRALRHAVVGASVLRNAGFTEGRRDN